MKARYSINEAWDRIYRSWLGQELNEIPGTLTGYQYSIDESASFLAEGFNNSLPGENLVLPASIYHGSMYADNIDQDVIIGDTETYYAITGSFSGGDLLGFEFQSNHELKCLVAGKFLANWSLSAAINGANQDLEGEVLINHASNPQTSAHQTLASANDYYSFGGTGIITLAKNDTVQLGVSNNTSTTNVNIQHGNLTLVRVGL